MDSQYAFNHLPLAGQLRYIQENGQLLFSKETENHRISLLNLHDFFVEIWFNLNMEMVDSLISYKNTALLEKFVDQVNIDALMGKK